MTSRPLASAREGDKPRVSQGAAALSFHCRRAFPFVVSVITASALGLPFSSSGNGRARRSCRSIRFLRRAQRVRRAAKSHHALPAAVHLRRVAGRAAGSSVRVTSPLAL
jgi:hypothetical protein